jgi:hypothetical protein
MARYIYPAPTPENPLPKPVKVPSKTAPPRVKKRDYAWEAGVEELPATTEHDRLLYACVHHLINVYPTYNYLHVPNALYELLTCKPEGRYFWVLGKAMGQRQASELKEELADAFKGMLDLAVWSPRLPGGHKLSMVGEIKVGQDRVRASQSRWAKGELVRVWGSLEAFTTDMAAFKCTFDGMSKE